MGGRGGSGGRGIKFKSKYEDIQDTKLIYGTAHITSDYIDIDGYSNKKTIDGALKDLADAVSKYDKGEARVITESIKNKEIMVTKPDSSVGPKQYILEWEDVPSATKETADGEMKHRNARWYMHVRFIR